MWQGGGKSWQLAKILDICLDLEVTSRSEKDIFFKIMLISRVYVGIIVARHEIALFWSAIFVFRNFLSLKLVLRVEASFVNSVVNLYIPFLFDSMC